MSQQGSSSFVHRLPFFYGWVILVVATLGYVMTSPGQTPVISIFIDHFIADLEISRSLISTLYMIGTITGGLTLSFWGRQIDQRGSRIMMALIAGLLGLASLYMGFVQGPVMLGFGYVLLRMFGQGALSLVSQNVINQWWVRRRGLVIGISGVLVSLLSLGLFPNVVHSLLQRFDWRTTYPILGVVLIFGMAPLSLLLIRDRPEKYGLAPDGDASAYDGAASDVTTADLDGSELADALAPEQATAKPTRDWTLASAVRTPAFWTVALSFAASSMLGTGLYFHMVDIFQSRGLPAEVAAAIYAPISLTSALVRLGSGYLADRVQLRYLLAAAMATLSTVLVMALLLNSVPLALLYGVLMGLNGGLTQTIGSIIWASYFGRRHLGAIAGLASTVSVIASAVGPLPLGLARDLLGSYNTALAIEAAVPLVLAVANLFVGRPQRRRVGQR